MSIEFRFPDVGEGIAEGEIVEWRVKPGDAIGEHDTLVVVETDKAVVEIPSPVAGTVLETRGEPGEMIAVGAVLAVIGGEGEASAPETVAGELPGRPALEVSEIPIPGGRSRPAPVVETLVHKGSVGVVGQLEEAPEGEEDEVPGGPAPAGGHPGERVKILPRDRMLARRLGVDPDGLRGTGADGRVTGEDVRRAAEEGFPGRTVTPVRGRADRDAYGPVERVKLRGVRRKVAEAMVRSLASAAQVTTTDRARVGLLMHILDKEKGRALDDGIRLTPLAFVAKAAAKALGTIPWLNAAYDEASEEVVIKGYVNLGVAVETRDGLIVPIVRDAHRKAVFDLARDIQAMARKARDRSLSVEDLRGGTFTLSNYGALGGEFATPILNPPESGLLGLGRIREEPVVDDGALRIEPVLPLSLTFDHRVVDGATAQRFLNEVVGNLQDPDRFLLG